MARLLAIATGAPLLHFVILGGTIFLAVHFLAMRCSRYAIDISAQQVFDVAWSGKRRVDTAIGKLPAVSSSVDLAAGKYANSISAAQLSKIWADPAFKADQPAVYYTRVIEIPTPHWTTHRSLQLGLPILRDVPQIIQERAWSSPIWHSPKARTAS